MDTETDKAKNTKRNARLALRAALRDLEMKHRLAISADRKAKAKEAKALRLTLKAEQLRGEAAEANKYAEQAAELAESARVVAEQKLEEMRKVSQNLRHLVVTKKTGRKNAKDKPSRIAAKPAS